MANTKYTFDHEINSLLQIGDTAFFMPIDAASNTISTETVEGVPSSDSINLGAVSTIGSNYIMCEAVFDASDIDNMQATNGFILFQKNPNVNETGLKGYYAEISMRNFTNHKAELFSVGSEVHLSSK